MLLQQALHHGEHEDEEVNEVRTKHSTGHSTGPQPARAQPRRRRRWPWLVPLLLGIAGVTGAVVRNSRPRQTKLERLPTRSTGQPTLKYRDQVATGRSPTGNGVVRAERPSADAD